MSHILARTVSLILGTFLTLSIHAAEVGQVAPDFDLSGGQGAVKLSDYKGKVVYLDFWASGAVPASSHSPG